MEANNEKKHRRMRRKLIGAVGIFLLCLCASFSLKSVDSQAAVKVATSSNGKYMYYSVQGTIYRIDTNTGKTKKIVKIKNTNWITNISYYKGYLYFTADYYYYMEGTDGTKPYVCRVKTNGKGFKKLAKGTTPVVYNGKIYYESMTFTKNSYDVSDAKTQGFQRMNLDGSKKKRLISGNSYYGSMTVVNNRIYYITGNTRCDQLYSANLDGTDQKYITSGVSSILTDGTDVYYVLTKELHKISTATGEDTVPMTLAYKSYRWGVSRLTNVYAVRDGKIYFFNNNTSLLRYYDMKTKKFTKIKKFNTYMGDLQVGKGPYMIVRKGITGKKNISEEIVKIKKNGKGYKSLKKYFRP